MRRLQPKSNLSLFGSQAVFRPRWLKYYFLFKPDPGWKADKHRIADLLEESGHSKIAHRVRTCMERVAVFKCGNPDCGQTELRIPFTCKTFICPECCKTAFFSRYREYEKVFKGLTLPAGHRLQFITLTQRHSQNELPSTVALKKLFKDARKFVNRLYPRKSKAGALGVLEIGKNKNIHVHLVVVGKVYSRSEMSRLWYKITGDSYILDRKDVTDTQGRPDPEGALRYILKYIKRPLAFDSLHDAVDYLLLMQKFRRVRTFWVFYHLT